MKPQSRRDCLPLDPSARVALRLARLERGLSLKQVSAVTGIEPSQLCRFEVGDSNPTLAVLTRLCNYLDLEFSYPTCHVWRDARRRMSKAELSVHRGAP
jgi:transcriptional regulator with XRE-family HTH domain